MSEKRTKKSDGRAKADTKVRRISVRLNEGEKTALYKIAYAKNMSISDVIRAYLHEDNNFSKLYDPTLH